MSDQRADTVATVLSDLYLDDVTDIEQIRQSLRTLQQGDTVTLDGLLVMRLICDWRNMRAELQRQIDGDPRG